MVPEVGLEPTRCKAHDFESRSSANSDTLAGENIGATADAKLIISFADVLVKIGAGIERLTTHIVGPTRAEAQMMIHSPSSGIRSWSAIMFSAA